MKKNKLGLLVLSIVSLSACTIGNAGAFSWDSYKNNSISMSLESAKYKNYKLADYSKLEERKNTIEEAVKVTKNRNKFVQYMNLLNTELNAFVNSYVIASTKYYADADQDYKAKADTYYSKYLEGYNFVLELENDIYHSSKEIKEAYEKEYMDILARDQLTQIKYYDQLIEKANELARARERAARAGDGWGWGHRAIGWSVEQWKSYLVWEMWPELFVPNQPWKIVKNSDLWQWGSINVSVNLWWVVVNSGSDEEELAQTITENIIRQLQLYKKGII